MIAVRRRFRPIAEGRK
jgi:hemerythrin-like domain-containing protein